MRKSLIFNETPHFCFLCHCPVSEAVGVLIYNAIGLLPIV
jgi:hypothetical protein